MCKAYLGMLCKAHADVASEAPAAASMTATNFSSCHVCEYLKVCQGMYVSKTDMPMRIVLDTTSPKRYNRFSLVV
jgi:hypothetical protein